MVTTQRSLFIGMIFYIIAINDKTSRVDSITRLGIRKCKSVHFKRSLRLLIVLIIFFSKTLSFNPTVTSNELMFNS